MTFWCLCLWENIVVSCWHVFWCSSLGDAMAFAHFSSSSHGIEFLTTLGTMCHLKLWVWKNTLSFCLLYLFVLFVFVWKKKKKKLCYVIFKHELHCNYGCISWVYLTSWTHHVIMTHFWLRETSHVELIITNTLA